VAEALRAAVDRTLSVAGRQARAGSALPRERATELLDEVAKRGREARDELARRGQEASEELAQRLESLERRLVALEDAIRTRSNPKPKD
jgi:hypothetical protein